MSEKRRCPVTGATTAGKSMLAKTNQDWWPDSLNLDILHQHTDKSKISGNQKKISTGV